MNLKYDGAERTRNASLLLSTTGAAVAGIGLGALLEGALRPAATAILAAGIFAHIVGMTGNRRAQFSAGYQFSGWEMGAYWLCWALIAALGGYLILSQLGIV